MNRLFCFFWAIWWGIACFTDVSGGLKKLNLIDYKWAFADNFDFLVSCLSIYSPPLSFVVFLFVGIILWCGLSSALFIRASYQILKKQDYAQALTLAYQVSLALWLVFFLADQLVMKFDLEENHMVQGGFEFLGFIAFTITSQMKHTRDDLLGKTLS